MMTGLRKSLISVAISGLLATSAAQATNGYFMHGYSTINKGMAGAGAAWSQDALASAANPAGMAFIGDRLELGLQIFSPSPRSYTVTGSPPAPAGTPVLTPGCAPAFTQPSGACTPPFSVNPGTVESENDFFLLPHFAYNRSLNPNTTVGLSVYGNGGMNTEYTGGSARLLNPNTGQLEDFPGTFGAGTAGVNLEQMFFNLNTSYKFDSKHAVGGSLIFVGQRFRAQGLEQFSGFSLDPSNLAGNRNSYSYGFGLKFGYQGEVAPNLRVGVSYQTKMSMGEFDEYKGLFAESGDFDIPSTYTVGVSYDLGKSGTVVADYQRINYSDVTSISNPISKLTGGGCLDALNSVLNGGAQQASGATCLGGSDGAGFGWEDIGIIKVGYQWTMSDIDWRVGFSHSDQPIPESETLFNILAPATPQQHVTAGMTMPLGSDQEISVAVMYALEESVKGPNPFDGGATQIEIEMSQLDIQAGWALKF